MKLRNNHQAGTIGDKVAVPMSTVDRDRVDVRDILVVVVDKTDNDQYKRVVKGGLLNRYYSINQFDLCRQCLLGMDVCVENYFSLRKAESSESCFWRSRLHQVQLQWYQALKNKLLCFKAKVKCNSRCHLSFNCCNK